MDGLLTLGGLLLLVIGGDFLVRGASGIALLAKMTPLVVGLTIVAAGTSMPELVVSVRSAWVGSPGLAVGNIVGSNIFNVGMILGIAALVRPLKIHGSTLKREWPVMLLAALLLHLLARDGLIDRTEGLFFLCALVIFVAFLVWISKLEPQQPGEDGSDEVATASFGKTGAAALALNLGAVMIGVGLLSGGAHLLVQGAVGIASSLGVSETVIGLTVVAAGTSAPELITSLVAGYRGQDDLAVANVVGSNIFNVLAIGGGAALVLPLSVPEEVLVRDDLWMLALTLALFPLMRTGLRITRGEGALLLGAFVAYLVVLVRQATV